MGCLPASLLQRGDGTIDVLLIAGALNYMIFKGPFQPKPFCDSMIPSSVVQQVSISNWPEGTLFGEGENRHISAALVQHAAFLRCAVSLAQCVVTPNPLFPLIQGF